MSSWMKMEASTPNKPEVLAITVRLGWDDPDLTVGKLFRVWNWFDQHTVDGVAQGVVPALLDRLVGVSGFMEAMQEVGWLVIDKERLRLPNFDRHNGSTAKKRALTAKRVASFKARKQGDELWPKALPLVEKGGQVFLPLEGLEDANGTDGVYNNEMYSVSDVLPREEKNREDIYPVTKVTGVVEAEKAGSDKDKSLKGEKLSSDEDRLTKAALWQAGKVLLKTCDMDTRQAGLFIGELIKLYTQKTVMEAVRIAVKEQPADAASFMVGVCKRYAMGASEENNKCIKRRRLAGENFVAKNGSEVVLTDGTVEF